MIRLVGPGGAGKTTIGLSIIRHRDLVTETVRRQLRRPFSRPADREEQVIRERLPCYLGLATKKFETNRPIQAVVDDLVTHLLPGLCLDETTSG